MSRHAMTFAGISAMRHKDCSSKRIPLHSSLLQYSKIPEEDESVSYTSWTDSTRTYTRAEALREQGRPTELAPLSQCPDQCSRRGWVPLLAGYLLLANGLPA